MARKPAFMMISSVGDADAISSLYDASLRSERGKGLDSRPYTIYCKTCRTIIGDSTAVACNIQALKAISLVNVKDVTVDEEARMAAKGGEDEVRYESKVLIRQVLSLIEYS
jgi:hypothetical protein